MNASAPTPSPVEAQVDRIRTCLREQNLTEALGMARALANQVPENRDVLYLKALAERHSRLTAEALATLQVLETHHPNSSLLYQERGHCYVALKDAPRAIEAYERAVQINPALPVTWSMLEGLYRMVGQ